MAILTTLSKLFPKCLTVILFAWTFYVTVTHVDEFPPTLLFFVISLEALFALYTYFQVITVGPGHPMDFPGLRVHNLQDVELGHELPPEYMTKKSLTVKHDGRFRVCQTCQFWKPDRSHHCSTCNKCVLKMDHHCPWFAECIGFKNQKYFIQYLIYTTLYALTVTSVTFLQLYMWFKRAQFEEEIIDLQLLSVWLLGIAVSISVTFFTGFSIYQLCENQTTIEVYSLRKYRDEVRVVHGIDAPMGNYNVFDLGSAKANWEEVMGATWREWCLPISKKLSLTSVNPLDERGLYFAVNRERNNDLLESADLQERLLRRVTPKSSLDIDRPIIN